MNDAAVTGLASRWTSQTSDAVRCLAWSPGGRLLVVAADGTARVDESPSTTRPACGDPIAACWSASDRVAVADAAGYVVRVGGGRVALTDVPGVISVAERGGFVVAAGGSAVHVIDDADPDGAVVRIEAGVGRLRACRPVTAALWAVVGATGLALVDVRFAIVDDRVPVEGLFSLAVDPAGRYVAAGDVGGSAHLFRLDDTDGGEELAGYRDPVRHLAFTVGADHLVAAADDELTWWRIENGTAADGPVCAVGHDAAVTALAAHGPYVASGDAIGRLRLWSGALPDHPLADARLHGEVTVLSWSDDGRRLAAGTAAGQVATFDVAPGLVV